VETAIGRLVTDEALRRVFAASPALALCELEQSGVELTAVEWAALERLDPADILAFAQAIDPRLVKASLARHPADRERGNDS
jgi:hypothetical protein